ncbi:MAG: AAA family ATPase, partial [Myxococcales bacterium]|nr:AAA family ATPase [Myxococcales bacterium]
SERPPNAEAFLGLVRDVAFKREGLVLRADPHAVAVAFGALLRTGGDADRALRAALALRDDASEAAPGLRLGFLVANAPTVVQRDGQGSVRVELRRGVTAQLDVAARRGLEGPVMVSGNLVDLLADAWRIGDPSFVDPPEGTGSAQVVDPEIEHVAPLLGPANRDQRRPLGPPGQRALVGRELPLKTLRDAFSEAIRARRSRAVLVLGEAGLGKRALVERFVASLPRTACWVLRASGSWSRRNIPMGVFLDLLARFLEIEHQTPSARIGQRLAALGLREAEVLGQTLATSLGLADAEAPQLPARTRRDRLWRLVRRLIIGLAQRRPVLVIIENLQFHDEQSLDLLREWIQAEQPWPVLGVATGRPGNRRVELVRREPNVMEIRLQELDAQARRELVARRFEDPDAAQPLTEAIVARTGGNPLFIEQTLASLIERGVVAWNAQGRHLVVKQPGAQIALPRTIEAALGERLEELSPADREVLQGAAVLGRHFRAAELPPLLAREVDEALTHLDDRGFIERIEGARTGTESHRFTTVSLHETCKATLSPAQARRLHGRAAELRRARPDYAEEHDAGPIAEHLMAAGRPTEAAEPALCAAEHASEVAGNVEAYYYYSLALRALTPDDPRRFEALLRRERILRAWGRRRAQVADIRQLLDTAERRADPQQLAIASVRLLRFYLEVGRPQSAERLLPRVSERVDAVPDPQPFMAVLAELRSELAFVRGRFDEAEQHAQAGLAHCGHDTRGLRQRARLLRSRGQVKAGIGRFDEAREAFEEALSLARRIDNVRLEANLLNSLGEVAGRSTHYQEAIDYFKASLAIDRELGDRFTTGRKLANLGMAYATIGLWRRAERYLRKALELHEAVGHPGEWGDVVVALGEVVASLGDLDASQALL